jgi:hypothetical protein
MLATERVILDSLAIDEAISPWDLDEEYQEIAWKMLDKKMIKFDGDYFYLKGE